MANVTSTTSVATSGLIRYCSPEVTYFVPDFIPTPATWLKSMLSRTTDGVPKSGSLTTTISNCTNPKRKTGSGAPLTVPAYAIVVVPAEAIETTARAGLLPTTRPPMIPTSSNRTTVHNGLRVFMFRSFSFASQGGREDFVRGLEGHALRARDRSRQRSHER